MLSTINVRLPGKSSLATYNDDNMLRPENKFSGSDLNRLCDKSLKTFAEEKSYLTRHNSS